MQKSDTGTGISYVSFREYQKLTGNAPALTYRHDLIYLSFVEGKPGVSTYAGVMPRIILLPCS